MLHSVTQLALIARQPHWRGPRSFPLNSCPPTMGGVNPAGAGDDVSIKNVQTGDVNFFHLLSE